MKLLNLEFLGFAFYYFICSVKLKNKAIEAFSIKMRFISLFWYKIGSISN
jgi:hypothetical protein